MSQIFRSNRNSEIHNILHLAGSFILLFLVMMTCFFLFYPADRLGIWARIVGVGFVMGAPFAALSVVWDMLHNVKLHWGRAQLIVAGACALAVSGYAVAAHMLTKDLQTAIAKVESKAGCMKVFMAHREPFVNCYTKAQPNQPTLRVPQEKPLPANMVTALRGAEQVDQPYGIIANPVQGTAHAVKTHLAWHTLKTQRGIGGSGLGQQEARIFLAVPRGGTEAQVLIGKAKVYLGASVLDGFLTREKSIQLYAEIVPLGTLSTTNLQGIGAGALVVFGKKLDDLSLPEALTLASLINVPTYGFPVAKPGDAPGSLEKRRARLHEHFSNVVKNSVRHGLITQQQAEQAESEFGTTFVAADQQLMVLPPAIHAVRAEVLQHVPDADRRYLRVDTDYDPAIQAAVERATDVGLKEVATHLPAANRPGIKSDIAVVNSAGHVVALMNLANSPSDAGSVHKLLLYPFAVTTHCLSSMEQTIHITPEVVKAVRSHDGTPLRADEALAKSSPEAAATLLSTCVSPHSYANFLGAAAGWRISNPALVMEVGSSMSTGSGVSASPLLVASTIRMYSATKPGVIVQPSLCTGIRDLPSDAVLFAPEERRIFSADVANQITQALHLTSKIGTTRGVLNKVAELDPELVAKTGTSHFFKNGKLSGGGGAWAATGANGLFFGIRTTTTNHDEIPLDGAVGAGIVARSIYYEIDNVHPAPRLAKGSAK